MNKYAFCIGIYDYPGTNMDLNGCANDAEDWSETLKQREFNVNKLPDKEATKEKIVKAISELLANSKDGGSLITTFSGHGTYQPDFNGDEMDGLDEALCPYDIHINRSALTDAEILNLFSKRKTGFKLLLISDTCHSGTIIRVAPVENYDAKIQGRFNGAFTYYALKTLKSMNSNASYSDWHSAVSRYLPSAIFPQSP